MGFNTAAIILNDHLHLLAKDAKFPERLHNAILTAGRPNQYNSGFEVLPSQHADTVQIVAIGGNDIQLLGYGHWTDDHVGLLRKLADQMGYRIVKLPEKKK